MSAARPSRVAADLLDSAARIGRQESRSATQQLDHWARVGRNVSMHQTAARRRVEAALAGDLPLTDLSPEERVVVHAELDVGIAERARATSFGKHLAFEGVTTVALDANGRLVEHHPDGTMHPVEG
jgi:deoxyxylulose-5-phosphate synthase